MSKARRGLWPAILSGLKGRCPACDRGALFRAYLKVNARCEACGTDLARYPADDGPAYVTILLVGHVVIGPLFFFPVVWETSPWISLPVLLSALAAITLAALPRVKGGWIGLMYALGTSDRDARLHTADVAD